MSKMTEAQEKGIFKAVVEQWKSRSLPGKGTEYEQKNHSGCRPLCAYVR